MAVKRFCDVCGAEITDGRQGGIESVTIVTGLPVQDPHLGMGELCRECNHRLGNTIRGAWDDLVRAVRKEIGILQNRLHQVEIWQDRAQAPAPVQAGPAGELIDSGGMPER